jgi:hypothetical protein
MLIMVIVFSLHRASIGVLASPFALDAHFLAPIAQLMPCPFKQPELGIADHEESFDFVLRASLRMTNLDW